MSQLASRWAEAGHAVDLITLAKVETDRYELDERVVRHGLGLMQDSAGPIQGLLANIRRVRRLRRELVAVKPDFILSFCDRMNIVTAAAARSLGVPLWLAEHSDPRKQQLGLLWERWRDRTYRRASGCVVLTESIAGWMKRRFPKLPMEVIPPAITPPDPLPTKPAVEQVGKKRLLAIGRHSPEKNMPAVLRAWQGLQSEFPDWRLVMAGDGPEHAQLVHLGQELGLGKSVEFTGWVSDPWRTIAACDLVVLPSHYEGFPVTLLEAMYLGTACVSTPSCESVQDFATGGAIELARSTEPEDIAAALRTVMLNPERRSQLGRAGHNIAQRYTWKNIGPRWDEVLGEAKG